MAGGRSVFIFRWFSRGGSLILGSGTVPVFTF